MDSTYDLRAFLKAVGGHAGHRIGPAAAERAQSPDPVELLDANPLRVNCAPAPVAGFVDGVQAATVLTWRERRPITFAYVAAGAIVSDPATGAVVPRALREQETVLVTAADEEWVRALGVGTPAVHVIDDVPPPDFDRTISKFISLQRETFEKEVVDTMLAHTDDGLIVCDGAIVARPESDRIVGVVKTAASRYLEDERVLYTLPEGWRSPRFVIQGNRPRYSCYLRLFSAENSPWSYGLIRLESFDNSILDSLAARCLIERQSTRSRDPRGDRHLSGVRTVEDFLRARRPQIFNT